MVVLERGEKAIAWSGLLEICTKQLTSFRLQLTCMSRVLCPLF